nr:MAG TPA: hypothetical protein [Caudoviricetes sp.]
MTKFVMILSFRLITIKTPVRPIPTGVFILSF